MIAARVVQVFAPAGAQGRGHTSSGVVLAPGLVLTARHGVAECDGDPEVRLLGGEAAWCPCEIAWIGEGDCDAALLRTRGGETLGADGPLRLGRLVGERRVGELRAVGFPWAQVRAQERGSVSATEAIDVAVDPLSGRAPGRSDGWLVVHVDGSVPSERDDGGSPWQGMSGAALLRGDVVVGLIAGDPSRFGADRLLATPATALAADHAFAAIAPAELVDVELLGVLDAPYRAALDEGAATGLAQLLDSRAEVVAFRGRESELATLQAWCEAEPRLGVALIRGPGGIGKTRLAAELCARLRRAGAVAGFWNPRAEARALAGVAAATPTLVVVDEAHTMPAAVAEVVLAEAQRAVGGSVRVVLLARNAADWWRHTVADAVADEPAAAAACRAAFVVALGPVATGTDDRRAAFLEAARDLRARLAPSEEGRDPEVPDLSDGAFDAILYIQLAAGRAIAGDGDGGEGAEDLLAWALAREARYWRATAKASDPPLDADREVLARAVAVATLAVADTEDAAAAALAAIPDLAESARDRRAVARWLRHLYPHVEGDSWLPGLVPDELGDALVRSELRESPGIARTLLDDPTPEQAESVLRVLDRAARGDDAVEQLLEAIVSKRLRALWRAALAAARQSGGGLGDLMARALERSADPGLAGEVLVAVPRNTVALRGLAVTASRLVVQQRFEEAQKDPAATEALFALAEATTEHAIRLAAVQRVEEALAAAEESVRLYRELAGKDPAHARRLASALLGLANRQASVGLHQQALDADAEAVGVLRGLQRDDPGARLEFGRALSHLSSDLGRFERIDEALGAAEWAVSILEPLFAATDHPEIGSELAGAYTNFSNRLTDAGRQDAALEATKQAVAVYRRIAEDAPDAYAPKLGEALANVALDLRNAGALADALAAASEAVAIFRGLAARAPGIFDYGLSHALNSLALALADLERLDEALDAGREVVGLRRGLAARNPAFDEKLASALHNLSIDLRTAGREEEAQAARAEVQAIVARTQD